MKVEIKKDELVRYLIDALDLDQTKEAIKGLKRIDWNPFDADEDEFDTPWKEIKNNKDIIVEAIVALAETANRLVIEGNKLTSQQKHDAVVAALDEAIILPFWAEPFDGKILDLLVTAVVNSLNAVKKLVGASGAPHVYSDDTPRYLPNGQRNPDFIAPKFRRGAFPDRQVSDTGRAPEDPTVADIHLKLTKAGKISKRS